MNIVQLRKAGEQSLIYREVARHNGLEGAWAQALPNVA